MYSTPVLYEQNRLFLTCTCWQDWTHGWTWSISDANLRPSLWPASAQTVAGPDNKSIIIKVTVCLSVRGRHVTQAGKCLDRSSACQAIHYQIRECPVSCPIDNEWSLVSMSYSSNGNGCDVDVTHIHININSNKLNPRAIKQRQENLIEVLESRLS